MFFFDLIYRSSDLLTVVKSAAFKYATIERFEIPPDIVGRWKKSSDSTWMSWNALKDV